MDERMELHPEIFEPYDRLIEITLLGEKKLVPENNSILPASRKNSQCCTVVSMP